jgi:hypothetical protein
MTFKEVYMTNKKITKSKKQEKRTLEHKHQKSKKISEKDLGKVHGGTGGTGGFEPWGPGGGGGIGFMLKGPR